MVRTFDPFDAPDRSGGADREPLPGLELTDAHREVLTITERHVPGPPAAPDVRTLCYRPKDATGPLPAILSLHGGAFCIMSPDTFAGLDAGFAANLGCHVIGVDYRLAPEDPFPAAIEDCWAVLNWLATTDDLDVDPDRIAVHGASAGGALAAALCQMTRDRQGPDICFQSLFIPVTDDRMASPSMNQAFADPTPATFDRPSAERMWFQYLGADHDHAHTSPYAAPLRAESFADLPAACVLTYGNDPLRDEGIAYAMALMAEGIEVELHNCPGAQHGGAAVTNPEALMRSLGMLNDTLAEALRR